MDTIEPRGSLYLITKYGTPGHLNSGTVANSAIAWLLNGGEDVVELSGVIRQLRARFPGSHVGLLVPDRKPFVENGTRVLCQLARADFVVAGPGPRTGAAVRNILLTPARLPELADNWIRALYPDASELSFRFFSAVHDPLINRRTIPEIAAALGSSARSLRRHVGRVDGATPVRFKMLGRLVCAAQEVARRRDRTIAQIAGAHRFFHYPDFYKVFVRYFGFPPSGARHLMGPAALWSVGSEREEGRIGQQRPTDL